MRNSAFAGSVLAVVSSVPAMAGLNGSTASVQYYFPDLATPYVNASATPPSFVIGSGAESSIDVEHVTFIGIDFTDDSLVLDFDTLLNSPTFTDTPFNGLVFTGSALSSIQNISVDPSSTFGFNPAGASIVGNELRLDWGGVTYGDDQTLTLHFDFGAVPEPATWAMLIAGFGITGLASRRRRAIAHA